LTDLDNIAAMERERGEAEIAPSLPNLV